MESWKCPGEPLHSYSSPPACDQDTVVCTGWSDNTRQSWSGYCDGVDTDLTWPWSSALMSSRALPHPHYLLILSLLWLQIIDNEPPLQVNIASSSGSDEGLQQFTSRVRGLLEERESWLYFTEKCKIQIFAQILCYCLQSNKRRIIIFNLKQSWLSVTVSVEMSVMVRLILSLLRILLHQIPKRMTAVEDLLDEGAGILWRVFTPVVSMITQWGESWSTISLFR